MYSTYSNLSITWIILCMLIHSRSSQSPQSLYLTSCHLLVSIYKQTQPLPFNVNIRTLTSVFLYKYNYELSLVLSPLPYLAPLSLFQVELTFVFTSHQCHPVSHQHAQLEVCDLIICSHHIITVYSVSCVISVHLYCMHHMINQCIFRRCKRNRKHEKKTIKSCKRLKSSTKIHAFLLTCLIQYVCHSNCLLSN